MCLYRQAQLLIAKGTNTVLRAMVTTVVVGAVFAAGSFANATTPARKVQYCPPKDNPSNTTLLPNPNDKDGATLKDLVVAGVCQVNGGTYNFHEVNIINDGQLIFSETTTNQKTDFYVKSIVVENGGSLTAGTNTSSGAFGAKGGVLTFHFFGKAPTLAETTKTGIACSSPVTADFPACGIPKEIWNSNILDTNNPTTCTAAKDVAVWNKNLPGDVDDCFYQYKPLPFNDKQKDRYFGYKVLAVSFGGTLQLFGYKGAIYGDGDATCKDSDPACSGESWVRLNTDKLMPAGTTRLVLSRVVQTWRAEDKIVVTTSDYLPGHSEQCTIASIDSTDRKNITIKNCVSPQDKPGDTPTAGLKWPHNGKPFDLSKRIPQDSGLTDLKAAETRAVVALLSRSIRLVSEGDTITDSFSKTSGYYFGGHTVIRQGFKQVQIQGVEFFQMGQGGQMGHYPVHFHLARKTPTNTFVKDNSAWDSMTRWYVVHATQGVRLARNVGYLSVGHGFYLEDGTETDNKFHSNVGIFARAAVDNVQNPRQVPGIFAAANNSTEDRFPFHSDYNHPSVFWIMNGWNEFQNNVAAGAGTCGACYWLVPGSNSGPSVKMKWDSYAAEQKFDFAYDEIADPGHKNPLPGTQWGRSGMTPLQQFVGNSCTSAMNSFQVNSSTEQCFRVGDINDSSHLQFVKNRFAPDSPIDPANPITGDSFTQTYYPHVGGGGRFATRCPAGEDCSTTAKCANGAQDNCDATVLDHYTTSFNWAALNFAAIWLRPQWALVNNSAITDVQNAGITFVTGGGYTTSDVITGYWGLARKSVFIGRTQQTNAFASEAGPFNPTSGLQCDNPNDPQTCFSKDHGISIPITNFSVAQRLFSVYDGPSYQDSNAYLDIPATNLTLDKPPTPFIKCAPNTNNPRPCNNSGWTNVNVYGVRNDGQGHCYLPNAAIAWKQPNGFYYAPAFHSTNLFFNKVDIRHFVIEPLFEPGTNTIKLDEAKLQYCNWDATMFEGFTDIDRQTVLNDDDGSLTGSEKTISVNEDAFFNAPTEKTECASDLAENTFDANSRLPRNSKLPPATAKTSPYEHLTTVVYPQCAKTGSCTEPCNNTECSMVCAEKQTTCTVWNSECSTTSHPNACYGVPLYRQLLTTTEAANKETPFIRMMGQNINQRSTLTVNHGHYYVDTSANARQQRLSADKLNVFQKGKAYDVFFVYAKPTTKQVYTLFVGKDATWDKTTKVRMGHVSRTDFTFTPKQNDIWPAGWDRQYDSGTGLLTVTVNMASLADEFDVTKNDLGKTLCQPQSLCAWNTASNACECSITDKTNYLYDACHEKNAQGQDAICSWSVADLDCPAEGCIGFEVTFADTFLPELAPARPTPSTFASDQTFKFNWDAPFVNVSADIAGEQCSY